MSPDALELRKPKAAEGSASPETGTPDVVTDDDRERIFVCVQCAVRIAREKDLTAVDGKTLHTRINPGGHVHRFLTFKRAINVASVSEPSSEFTWFEGFEWMILMCASCRAHMGWRFDGESTFFALLTTSIRASG